LSAIVLTKAECWGFVILFVVSPAITMAGFRAATVMER
jgi:hypothetical protein